MQNLIKNVCLIPALTFSLNGCSSIAYYGQSIRGHLEVMNKSRNIEQLLEDETLDIETKEKLQSVLEILAFAKEEMKLPDNGSYHSYADIGRSHVVWNVFATEEFSFQPVKSCFLFVGCLSYRGYFSKQAAQNHAQQLQAKSHDVFLGGVSAYSTLGWFRDPVLNTMMKWSNEYLYKVIMHELTHQKFYIKNDSAFSEALADTVAMIALQRWFKNRNDSSDRKEYERTDKYERQFIELVATYKIKLQSLYESDVSDETKRRRKYALFDELENEYKLLKKNWNGYNGFDNWFAETPNNAKITAISTYREYLPGFQNIYESGNKNLDYFYQKVESLSKCSPEKRRLLLLNKSTEWSC